MRLRPHLSVIVHSPDEVELRHGVWNPMSYTVGDEARSGTLARLVEGLDGTTSPAELAAAHGVGVEEVRGLIEHLGDLDLLERRPSSALDAYLGAAAPWRVDDNLDRGQPVLLYGEEVLVSGLQRMLAEVLDDNHVLAVADDDTARAVLDVPDTSWLADGLATEERLTAFERCGGRSSSPRPGSWTRSGSR